MARGVLDSAKQEAHNKLRGLTHEPDTADDTATANQQG